MIIDAFKLVLVLMKFFRCKPNIEQNISNKISLLHCKIVRDYILFTGQTIPSFGQQPPVPYQRGPPQEYMEAITNKRLIEEVGMTLCCVYGFNSSTSQS